MKTGKGTDFIIRLFDVTASLFLLSVAAPCWLAVAILNLIFLGPPLFYVSLRQGKDGRPYRHIKLRSLLPGRITGRIFFEQKRMTRYGRLLRRLHLDEIPELFLVLSGKMSLVGPRPLPAALLEGLDTMIRQTVRPGWTGPAQLHLLRFGTLDKHRQIELDMQYVRHRSLGLNLSLLLRTMQAGLRPSQEDLDPRLTVDRCAFAATLQNDVNLERVAVIDWGIGGLPFFTALQQRHPSLPLLYFSDSGHTPYGRLSEKHLRRRLQAIITFLASRHVTRVVAACNTVSSILPLASCPLPVSGIIEAAVAAVLTLRPGTVGVVGTRRTVRAGRYFRELSTKGIQVKQKATQPLAALIEKGRGGSGAALRIIRRACRALAGIDVLILGCTHYAALKSVFQRFLPGTRIIDPAEELLERITITGRPDGRARTHHPVILTTGRPGLTMAAARLAFGLSMGDVTRVSL